MENVAVILTCFNRKEMTIRCIEKLKSQTGNYNLVFYICDDLSSDGTYEAIIQRFPDVNIIRSDGNLYWCKGMNAAMKLAIKQSHDFYLMVNDDVDFKDNALENMITTYKTMGMSCGIVGSVASRENGKITYGGRKVNYFEIGRYKVGVRSNTLLIPKKDEILECDRTNWNCFLIDQNIINEIGIIDDKYAHSLGDYDYALRMKKKNFKIYIAPEIVGYCENNSKKNTYYDKNTPRKKRLKQLLGPKGMPPKSIYRFAFRENGVLGIVLVSWRYFQYFRCILIKKDIG